MKANRFLEKLMDNLPAKIFSFVIALFLCLFYQLSLVDKKTIVVPLRVVQDGGVVRVGDVPTSVKVVVRSNSSEANLIHADGIKATIDLSYLNENGTFNVPVFLSVDDDLLAIDPLELKTKPEYISVKVEKKLTKAVRVEVPCIGDVAHGYGFSESIVHPDSVYITGPESIVNNTDSVLTETVDISDISTNRKFNVHLTKVNKMLYYDEEEFYEAEVVVEPIGMERYFTNLKINCINLSDEFEVENELPILSVKLGGTMSVLENYHLNPSMVSVDCSGIQEDGEYALPVKVKIPNYIKVIEKSFDSVTVKIVKKHLDSDDESESLGDNS